MRAEPIHTRAAARAMRRRCLAWCLAAAAGWTLAACAGTPAGTAAGSPTAGAAGPVRERALLEPIHTFSGARLASPDGAISYLGLIAPAALAARQHTLFVADRRLRQVYKYDPMQGMLTSFAHFPGGAQSVLAVGPDLSLYIADSSLRGVQHVSWDGRALAPLEHPALLLRPVAVLPDPLTGDVLVADSHYNHIVIFNSFNRPVNLIKPHASRSIDAMARGADGLYLVDRGSRQVQVIGADGALRYTFGDGELMDPHAIAIDRFNRVFVVDGFDDSIKVFAGARLVAKFGKEPVGFGFGRPTDLAIDHDILYVSDSQPPAVRMYRINPAAPLAVPGVGQ